MKYETFKKGDLILLNGDVRDQDVLGVVIGQSTPRFGEDLYDVMFSNGIFPIHAMNMSVIDDNTKHTCDV